MRGKQARVLLKVTGSLNTLNYWELGHNGAQIHFMCQLDSANASRVFT